jgi:hypothetical protein
MVNILFKTWRSKDNKKNEREKYSLLRDEKKVIHATLPAAATNIQLFSKKTCR